MHRRPSHCRYDVEQPFPTTATGANNGQQRQSPNARNPAPRVRPWAEVHACRIGAGENYLASQLRCVGVKVTQQQPVGRFLIDLAAWPVAFEVWTGGGFPTRSLELQRRRTVSLVEQGWTVAYVKTSQRYQTGFSPHVGRWLKDFRDLNLDGLAPPVVTFRGCGVALEATVIDGDLVHVPHPDPTWQRWADWTRGAEAEARREYAKQRARERRAERRLYGR